MSKTFLIGKSTTWMLPIDDGELNGPEKEYIRFMEAKIKATNNALVPPWSAKGGEWRKKGGDDAKG